MPYFFTAQQLTEALGTPWIEAEPPVQSQSSFANVPEVECTEEWRSVYKKGDSNALPDTLTSAIVHKVIVSKTHEGARKIFLAITDKFGDLPLSTITPLNLFPSLQPLHGPSNIDGRWIDPATASCLATYEFTRHVEGQTVKQLLALVSSIGKNTCHQFVVDADDRAEVVKKLVQLLGNVN